MLLLGVHYMPLKPKAQTALCQSGSGAWRSIRSNQEFNVVPLSHKVDGFSFTATSHNLHKRVLQCVKVLNFLASRSMLWSMMGKKKKSPPLCELPELTSTFKFHSLYFKSCNPLCLMQEEGSAKEYC